MDETEYHEKAIIPLQNLLEFLEELENSHDIECELEEGILNITMPDGGQYVINKHTPSRQVWVSSPYSGASYFEYNSGTWVPKRSQAAGDKGLEQFIKDEVISHLD